MQSFIKKRRWLLILLIFLFLSLAAIYQMRRKNSIILAKKEAMEIVLTGMENFLGLWRGGNAPLQKSSCKGRCRASFLQCLFEKKDREKRPHLLVRKGGREFGILANRQREDYYRIVTRENTEGVSIPSYGVFMEFSLVDMPEIVIPVLLEDSCNDAYLPQRIYAHGPFFGPAKKDWRWDNFSQHVYLDKHPVDFLRIAEWKKYNKSQQEITKDIVIPNEPKKLSLPASGLSKRQMENYCAFRGGQLLQTHYYDAATFYPGDFSDQKPLKNIRGPYPWTNKSKAFYTGESSFCHKVLTKECLQKTSYEEYQKKSTSWIGIFEILGGYLEAIENRIEPTKNLKASSFLFSADSPWHMLGKRAYWNGKGFSHQDFKWEQKDVLNTPSSPENFQVSFRCMRFAYD